MRSSSHAGGAPSSLAHGADRLVGSSLAARRLRAAVRRLARCGATILVLGETGVGKEVLARALHEESGRSPFVAVSLPELADGVLESELFGHARGAFTGAVQERRGLFERAAGGTLFLDEIGDAPLPLQAKLLRALEQREIRPVGSSDTRRVDVRILAATHRDLARRVREGRFREDLYYRLRCAQLVVPPLRERAEDVPVLARVLVQELSQGVGAARAPALERDFLAGLARHPWPGNVRELRAVLENVLVWWSDAPRLGWPQLAETLVAMNPGLSAEDQALAQRLLDAWRRHGGNQEAARRSLGLTRAQWRSRIARLALPPLRREAARSQPARRS